MRKIPREETIALRKSLNTAEIWWITVESLTRRFREGRPLYWGISISCDTRKLSAAGSFFSSALSSYYLARCRDFTGAGARKPRALPIPIVTIEVPQKKAKLSPKDINMDLKNLNFNNW